jgi:hypothetical protein
LVDKKSRLGEYLRLSEEETLVVGSGRLEVALRLQVDRHAVAYTTHRFTSLLFRSLFPSTMKASLFSFVAALGLLASSASFAAVPAAGNGPYKARKEAIKYDRKAEVERARREAAQRKYELERQRQVAQERQRLEAQRRLEQQRAAERARYEAQHRSDNHSSRDYGYRR